MVCVDLNLNDAGEYCCKISTNRGDFRSTCLLNIESSKLLQFFDYKQYNILEINY